MTHPPKTQILLQKQPQILALRALLMLTTLAWLPTAQAQPVTRDDGHYYFGLSAGQSRGKFDEEGIAARMIGPLNTATIAQRDERDTGYKVFLGYQFNRMIAIEGGYFTLGRFGFNANTVPLGTLDAKLHAKGVNLDLVGTAPLSDRWSALGRVGAQFARTRSEFAGTGAVVLGKNQFSERDTSVKVGLGLQYAFSPSFLMRAEVERYRLNDTVGQHAHANVASLSMVFPFGQAPTAQRRAAVAPMPMPMAMEPQPQVMAAAPPPPAPVVVVVEAPAPPAPPPAPPQPRRVSFSADSLFAFGTSTMQPAGQSALDTFSRDLKGTSYDKITVEGHADRLGSDAFNQKLSQQRADAVKAYLVGTTGLDAGRISTVGRGESTPVTQPGQCQGKSANATLITCLQPDRRVVVEVNGTR